MLKANSRKTLDIIAGQTKRNAKQAYMEAHPNAAPTTAQVNVSQLLKKPEAQIYLKQHINKATETVVDLMSSDKDDIRLRSAVDVLDRSHGKATQRTESTNTTVTLSLSLKDITEATA